jgi:hypothetical protein
MEDYMLPCLNKRLFGVECMGCGLQRALALIFQGEFTAAFNMYPAVYSLVALFIIIAINAFKNFKNANKIILILFILNVIIITSAFIIKTFFNQ